MGKIRFPNPGSDIDRLTHVFSLIAMASEGTDPFDLDFMTTVATSEGQASSQGAQGAMAVQRSRRDDRSRDPLYNQLKMYSEIYRMLGWIRPLPDSRLTFMTTLLGETVAFEAASDKALRAGLTRESLLSVVFPNTTTENLGVASQRPFSWLLQLAAALDGVITRHEMILGLLAQVDDRPANCLTDAANQIRSLRKHPIGELTQAAAAFAAAEGIQLNTLENYTRFPVGVLHSSTIGWGNSESIRGLYRGNRAVVAIRLTDLGMATAERVAGMCDVRAAQLSTYTLPERAAFASVAYYAMLTRAGFDDTEVAEGLAHYEASSRNVLAGVGASDPLSILFSPFTQESDKVLELAQGTDDQ